MKGDSDYTTDPDDVRPKCDGDLGAFPRDNRKQGGMTVREYAAIRIMAGLAADPKMTAARDAAAVAVDWADALIRELNQPRLPPTKQEQL